jgi:hypothetical protein
VLNAVKNLNYTNAHEIFLRPTKIKSDVRNAVQKIHKEYILLSGRGLTALPVMIQDIFPPAEGKYKGSFAKGEKLARENSSGYFR